MDYVIHSHRYGVSILETAEEYRDIWQEIKNVIENINDQMIIEKFQERHSNQKSISRSINELLKESFILLGWQEESPIFQESEYIGDTWRLDFAKENISMEVAFNHGSVVAWNLLKPVLASELNHVKKAIQTKIGVIICATQELKIAGGFDSAVGSYEKYLNYLTPLNNQLSIPLAIIGLKAPESFYIKHIRENGRNIGHVMRL